MNVRLIIRSAAACSLFALAVFCRGAAKPETGRITGRVVLDGPAPPEKMVVLDAASAAARGTNRTMTRLFARDAAGGLANVVVSIRDAAKLSAEPRTGEVSLTVTGALFDPFVIAAETDQSVRFVNGDALLHHFHLQGPPGGKNGATNFAVPTNGISRPLDFSPPDAFVKIKCDVHPWELAHVAVFDHPFFAVTQPDGTFDLPPLPPGRYIVEAHHPEADVVSREVTVMPGEVARIEMKIVAWHGHALYSVQSWPLTYEGFNTLPESNKLRVRLVRDKTGDVRCQVKNDEEWPVLIYNVRVQVDSEGAGTDGFGWDTILNDYPWAGLVDYNDGRLRGQSTFFNKSTLTPGVSGEFFISELTPFAWRLCILYQIESRPPCRCEAISNPIDPPNPWPIATTEQVYNRIQPKMLRPEIEKLLGAPSQITASNTCWYIFPPPPNKNQIGIVWNADNKGFTSMELKRAAK